MVAAGLLQRSGVDVRPRAGSGAEVGSRRTRAPAFARDYQYVLCLVFNPWFFSSRNFPDFGLVLRAVFCKGRAFNIT